MSFGFGFSLPSWQALSGGFSPASLFSGGTVAGAWYDPSDLSTMFTTSAGTTPVAMPGLGSAVSVGLMLDKSQGLVLGSELASSILGGTSGWTFVGAATVSGGAIVFTTPPSTNASAQYNPILTSGSWYRVQITLTGTGQVTVQLGSAGTSATFTAPGSYSFTGIASGGTPTVLTFSSVLSGVNNFVGSVTAVSVRTLPGNHAIAFNDTTARPELRARVNLLERSEEFDNAYWQTASNVTITANAGIAPDGTTTAELMTEVASTATHRVAANNNNAISGTSSTITYNLSCFYKANAGAPFALLLFTDGSGSNQARAWFNLSTGVKGSSQVVGNGVVVSYEMTPAANGYYLCSMICIAGSGGQAQVAAFVGMADADLSVSYAGSTGRSVLVWGADLRPANIGANVPAYQRIADANTYDTSGFPLYLRFDGIDDSMYTPANLNLSGTDKVAVFAGVRRLAEAFYPMVVESGATGWDVNNGAFGISGGDPSGEWRFGVRGAGGAGGTVYYDPVTYTPPITNVLSMQADLSGSTKATTIIPRVNGVLEQEGGAGTTSGGGNFGSYPLFIGARNNSSLFLNGHLHSLIIAGSAVSAGNISATEQWVAQKTGLVIP